jgi:type II secretory pathway pseudopilin PulG
MFSRRASSRLPQRPRRAFSLVEALIALAIMGLAGSVLLLSIESSLHSTTESVERTIADGIAQQLLDEILTKRYSEDGLIGPAVDELLGTSRQLFDDVDDYHLYVAHPLQDALGQPLGTGNDAGGQRAATFRVPAGFFQNWRQRVQVYYVNPATHTTSSTDPTSYRAIEVVVEKVHPDGAVVPLASRKRIVAYIPPPTS